MSSFSDRIFIAAADSHLLFPVGLCCPKRTAGREEEEEEEEKEEEEANKDDICRGVTAGVLACGRKVVIIRQESGVY
jgi:sulfopyruvate decarboxylase TPP-binding subunit